MKELCDFGVDELNLLISIDKQFSILYLIKNKKSIVVIEYG